MAYRWGFSSSSRFAAYYRQVERNPYDLLFGERQAPDGTPLGRPPRQRP